MRAAPLLLGLLLSATAGAASPPTSTPPAVQPPHAAALPPATAFPDAPRRATLTGVPLQQRFGSEQTGAPPQQLGVAIDKDGRLHVANAEGVLRFDGDLWETIRLPANGFARTLGEGVDGRIYVGGYDTFGVLVQNELGDTTYRPLVALGEDVAHEADKNIGLVWEAAPGPEGVYFKTDEYLHFVRYDGREHVHYSISPEVRSLYPVGDQLYTRVDGAGFSRLDNGHFVLEPGGEVFEQQPLLGVFAREGWLLVVGRDGLYRADRRGITLVTEHAGALRQARPYSAEQLSDGTIAIGTLRGDLFRFDKDYRLRERLRLGPYGIEDLAVDREGGLWAATENDLRRLAMPSPWSFYGADQGLEGNVFDFEWHNNALWLAGSRGFGRVARQTDGSVGTEWFAWTEFEGFSVLSLHGDLLLGHRSGLKVLPAGRSEPVDLLVDEEESLSWLLHSRFDPDLVYGFSERNLYLIRRKDGAWELGKPLSLGEISLFNVVERAAGELWLGDSRGGPQLWLLDVVKRELKHSKLFADAEGLVVDASAGTRVFELDGRIHVVSGERGFVLDGDHFVADNAPPLTLTSRPRMELDVLETPAGVFAYTTREIWLRAPGKSQWQSIELGSPLARGLSYLKFNPDGVIRAATWNGLLQFDPGEPLIPAVPLAATIERVTARSADRPEGRALATDSSDAAIEVPAGNSLQFRFGMVSLESGAEYRYQLHGGGSGWTAWQDRNLDIQAKPPGDYVLEIQARTRAGRTAPTLTYRFRVLPYWYQQWWVWAVGALLTLALLGLAGQWFVRRRTERYLALNRKLEARIAERTKELEDANRKLSEIATEDALTGVANRRALEQGLRREWFRCQDQRRPMSVLMIDVDHFKKFNDTHGHLEGDVLLKEIAQTLQRQQDPQRELLARYGGEEFALLLPGVHLEEACRRGEQIRAAVAARGGDNPVTVSIGAAGLVPDLQSEPNMLLRRADAALYRAKRAGRNRVEADTE